MIPIKLSVSKMNDNTSLGASGQFRIILQLRERLCLVFFKMVELFPSDLVPRAFPFQLGEGKALGTRLISVQAFFIIQDGGHVKFTTLGICRTIKIPTLGTDLTVKAPQLSDLNGSKSANKPCLPSNQYHILQMMLVFILLVTNCNRTRTIPTSRPMDLFTISEGKSSSSGAEFPPSKMLHDI